MAPLAFIGGAILSALISKGFTKLIEDKDAPQSCTKDPFQALIDRITPKQEEGAASTSEFASLKTPVDEKEKIAASSPLAIALESAQFPSFTLSDISGSGFSQAPALITQKPMDIFGTASHKGDVGVRVEKIEISALSEPRRSISSPEEILKRAEIIKASYENLQIKANKSSALSVSV